MSQSTASVARTAADLCVRSSPAGTACSKCANSPPRPSEPPLTAAGPARAVRSRWTGCLSWHTVFGTLLVWCPNAYRERFFCEKRRRVLDVRQSMGISKLGHFRAGQAPAGAHPSWCDQITAVCKLSVQELREICRRNWCFAGCSMTSEKDATMCRSSKRVRACALQSWRRSFHCHFLHASRKLRWRFAEN